MKKWLIIVAVFALFGGLAGYRAYQQHLLQTIEPEEDLPVVELVRLQDVVFRENVRFTADVEPQSKAAVVIRVDGRIVLRVFVEEGDHVEEGAPLAVVDEKLVNQQLAEAISTYETAKADYERYSALYEEEVISRQQLEYAERTYVSAKTALEQVRIFKGYHRVEAPVSGVIARRNIDPGDVSNSSMVAFIISLQDKVKVSGGMPERAFVSVRKGQKAVVTVDALPGKRFEAEVTNVSPTVDPATRRGTVEVMLPSEGILKPGMFARVEILLGEKTAPALPRDAIIRLSGTGNYVCYVLDDDRARLRNIETGLEQGEWVEITSGLERDDNVIASLSRRIGDGVKVRVNER